jgi:hypothetical protein
MHLAFAEKYAGFSTNDSTKWRFWPSPTKMVSSRANRI